MNEVLAVLGWCAAVAVGTVAFVLGSFFLAGIMDALTDRNWDWIDTALDRTRSLGRKIGGGR